MEGVTLHRVTIYEGCVSLEVQRSHGDEYVLFKNVELNGPPVKKIKKLFETL